MSGKNLRQSANSAGKKQNALIPIQGRERETNLPRYHPGCRAPEGKRPLSRMPSHPRVGNGERPRLSYWLGGRDPLAEGRGSSLRSLRGSGVIFCAAQTSGFHHPRLADSAARRLLVSIIAVVGAIMPQRRRQSKQNRSPLRGIRNWQFGRQARPTTGLRLDRQPPAQEGHPLLHTQ